MKRLAVLAVASLLTAGLTGCGGSSGGSSVEVEKAAHYSGSDRTAFLTKCAKDEGRLEIYTTQNPTLADALRADFMKRYPGIKVASIRRTSPDTAEAVSKEASAGVNKVDVVHLKVEVVEDLLDVFTSFDSPELSAYPPSAIGPEGKYVSSGRVPYGIIYNTTKVSAAEAPKTSDDLLDPKWKGKIALSTTGPGTQWIGWMSKEYGEDWVKAFGEQDIKTTEANTNAISSQVAAGEAWIAPAINLSGVSGLKDAPIKWVPIDSTMAEDTVEIAKAAPHPCAAMLYTDYVLSKAGQTISPDYMSARKDVPPSAVMKGIHPAGVWDIVGKHDPAAYTADLKKWSELLDRYVIG